MKIDLMREKGGGPSEAETGPHAKCRKYGTCRMNCVASCNTHEVAHPEDAAAAEKWQKSPPRRGPVLCPMCHATVRLRADGRYPIHNKELRPGTGLCRSSGETPT